MTLTLQLPDKLETELAAEAARLGIPLADYALYLLQSRTASTRGLRTGADVIAYWEAEGLLGTRPDITDP